MGFDREGSRVHTLMHNQDIRWQHVPQPFWRLQPPTSLGWLMGMGWRNKDYDERLLDVVMALIEAYPGCYITHRSSPDGLTGDWKEVTVQSAGWKKAETGTIVRGFDRGGVYADPNNNHAAWGQAWEIPSTVVREELGGYLSEGAWAIWKPSTKTKGTGGLPRIFAQDAYKTVCETDFLMLLVSSFDNAFTELAIHPELAE